MKKNATKNATVDIVQTILEDHKPLKQLIKILKDSEKHDLEERQEAFAKFCPLLATHAETEEQTLYAYMKSLDDLREEALEGDVEHGLADQMLEEAKRTEDEDLWSARVKVLAELVEHHIKEEEEELLPDFKEASVKEEREVLGLEYQELYPKVAEKIAKGDEEKTPSMQKSEQLHAH